MKKLYLFLQGAFGEMVFDRVKELNPLVYTYSINATRRKTDKNYLREGYPVRYITERAYQNSKIQIAPDDLVVCADWSKDFFHSKNSPIPVYHIHNSLLPLYRGYGTVSEQFLRGVTAGGVTLYKDNGKVDSGPIAYQQKIKISHEDTPLTYMQKCADISAGWVHQLFAGDIPALTEQNEDLASSVQRMRKRDALLDFNAAAIYVYNNVRAYSSPYFGSHFYHKGEKITVWRASIEKWAGEYGAPGDIIDRNKFGIEIVCGEGSVILNEVEINGIKYVGDDLPL